MLLSMTGVCSNMEPSSVLIAIYITVIVCCRVVTATLLDQKERKTPQAAEKANDLSCYVCDSMIAGEQCSNLNNSEFFIHKCQDDGRICMVKRYSYSISSENSSPHVKRLWAVQRNCTNKCESGCIVIGERTKLYACTACCSKPGCNKMNDGTTHRRRCSLVTVFCILALMAFTS